MRTVLSVGGRLETNFPNASEFVPETWLRTDESEKVKEVRDAWTRHQFACIPFNMGPGMPNGRRIIELDLIILQAKVTTVYKSVVVFESYILLQLSLFEKIEVIKLFHWLV